jgi:choline-sulfatase
MGMTAHARVIRRAIQVVVTTLAAVFAIGGCSPPGAPSPPLGSRASAGANVLLITIDTLRRDRLGAYGSTAGLTPVLDALAGDGTRFTHAYSHVPLTLPAHASILTGQVPARHGLHVNGSSPLPDDVPTMATVLKAAGYRTGAFVGAFVLDARFGLSRGFDEYDDRYPQGGGPTFAFAERRGADVVQAAAHWIESSGSGVPWFAWVHLFDPHAPYEAPAEYRTAGRHPYDAEVAYTDAMVGRLLDRLRQGAALARTLIIVTADHGESLGEHGETTHGLFAYDSTLAVPLIVRGAGAGRGVVAAEVGHADLLPTLADMVGVAAPPALDGVPLTRTPDPGRRLYFEALDAALTRGWAPLRGVVAGGWKFIDLPVPELYDLTADPLEAHNMAAREPARASALADEVRTRAAQAGARATAQAPATAVDEETARRLGTLGYIAATTAAVRPGRSYTADDDPKSLVALNERFNTALSAFNAGQADAALAGFRAVLAARADFLAARTSAATVLLATGRAPDAVAVLRDAPSSQSGSPELLAKLGVALRETGDLKSAARSLEAARAAGSRNPELANDLGVVYARLGRAADARTLFQELLGRDPDDAATWNNLGVLELSAGRPSAAASAFRRTVEISPDRGDAWQGLGAALVSSDRAGAVEAWRRAERLLPHDYDLLFNLGVVLAEGPAPGEAVPYLRRFVREAPRDRYAADIARVEAMLRQVTR